MKIINWLFGSFFRTIGRTIAILLMGGLLYYILASNGIGISDLFLDSVKADTFQVLDTPWKDENGDNLPEYYGSYIQYPITQLNSGNYYSGVTIPSNAKGFYITFTMRNISAGSTYHCSQYDSTGQYCQEYRTDNQSFYAFTIVMGLNDYIGSCYFVDDSIPKSDAKVERIKSMVYCPIPSNKSHVLNRVAINSYNALSNNSQVFYYIGLEKFLLVDIDGQTTIIQQQEQTNQAITNQTQQQQQQHQEMMDDNTTQAEDEGSSFFGNFTTEDHGGLNSIITAPLNTIRSLLNSSCTKLTLPLPYVNKNLELPCMNAIYTEHFGLFFSLYQTIILAIISYRCLRSIFFDITGFTNPDDDRIEVMDL